MSKTETAGTMTAQEAAKLLMLESTRRVQQLAADGYIHKADRDRYYTVSVVQGYIRFLKEDRANKSVSAGQARVADARARDYELRNARADHTLVELSEVEAVIDEISSKLKNEMEGVAAKVTRDIPLRRKIEAAIDAVFDRTATGIAETIGALATSGEAMAPDTEDDA